MSNSLATMRTGAARVTGRALWIRRVSKKGIVFHSLRHTMATLLARAKMHPSVAQKILRHANIETTLAIYRHVDRIEEMRAAVPKLDFGPLEEQAPFKAIALEPVSYVARNNAAIGVCGLDEGTSNEPWPCAKMAIRYRGTDWEYRFARAPNYASVRCDASLLRWPGVSGAPPARTTGCRCRSLRVIW